MQGSAAPGYALHEGCFVVRSYRLPGRMLADMMMSQGYAKVVSVVDGLIDS